MTGPMDLVPRLEDWLAEEDGARLPERVMDAVIAASGAMPQVRRRGGWRVPGAMRLVLGAALLSVAVLFVFGLYRLVAPPVGTESPSPSAAASVIESPSTEPSAAGEPRTFTSRGLGFTISRPSDLGPWGEDRNATAPPAKLTFPAGTCIYDLCWATFVVGVGTHDASLLDELATLVGADEAAGYVVETTATTLGGEPALSLAGEHPEGEALVRFRAVVAIHDGRSYVLSWSQSYGGPLSVLPASLNPLWGAFLGSFQFID